jgi:hypothetical protein
MTFSRFFLCDTSVLITFEAVHIMRSAEDIFFSTASSVDLTLCLNLISAPLQPSHRHHCGVS